MNRWIVLLAALLLALTCTGVCAQETRVFTDSLGREMEIDAEITRIAVSGPLAQIAVLAIAPDMLVGVSSAWDEEAKPFISEELLGLPVIGQLYGGKGNLNPESLLAAAPQIVIDVGEPKGEAAKDLDALSEQTGIPFVHVSMYLDRMDEAYAMLGNLLGREDKAKEIGDFCAAIYDRYAALAENVEKKRLLYVTGEEGLGVIAKNSYHSTIIDMLCDNLAVVDNPSSKGLGNEVDMEQILIWNPDVIVFSSQNGYDAAADDPVWQGVKAIADGEYYAAPVGPYHWMGFPPGAQRLLGMMWMGHTLYPEAAQGDLYESVAAYFDLFYHHALTREEFDALTARVGGK